MKLISLPALALYVCTALFTGCTKPIDDQSIIGYWKVSPETVEAMLREQAGDTPISDEDLGKQLARHFLSKMVIEFSGTEFNQYRDGRSGKPMPYSVVSVIDGVITLNIAEKVELSITATKESLQFPMPGNEKEFTWLRMNDDELAKLQQAIDEIENGPAATAKTEQRFMWTINAPSEKVEAYLQKYPDLIEARTEEQQTLLHYAIRFEKEELAKRLLTKGADVNAEDDSKETAFYMVATDSEPNESLLKLLLDAGSDIDHKSDREETALAYAIDRERIENARMLLKLGADVDAKAEIGKKTPLFEAIEDGETEIVQLLIENGANLKHTTFDSKSGALYVAARYGTLEIIQLLLDKGMDANAENADGNKPITNIAFRDEQKIEAVKLLVAAGADINEDQVKLLTDAIWREDVEFAKQLVEAGADFEMKPHLDKSAYEKAKAAGLTELVEFMDLKRSE